MAKSREWSKGNTLKMLAENSFSYQNVPLPHGLETGGEDRSTTAKAIFDGSLDGKSVFDIGCMYGYFCFAAEERGATRCFGADIDPENVAKSRLLARCRGSEAAFEKFDIESEDVTESYDYVLCLNVLHHLRNPLSALDKLIAATRERLILEVAGFAKRDRLKSGVSLPASLMLSRLPVIYAASGSTQTFFITVAAMRVMLIEQRADFAKLDVIPSGHKGRSILVAHKRRIDHLFVVAGMPAAGKSTFIDHLLSHADGGIMRSAGFDASRNWHVMQFGDLRENTTPALESVILHYNICKHLVDGDLYQHGRALSDLFSVANRVSVVTLVCPRQRLLAQFKAGRLGIGKKTMTNARRRKKIRKVLELYESAGNLGGMYKDWLMFLRTKDVNAVIVSHDGSGYTIQDGLDLSAF